MKAEIDQVAAQMENVDLVDATTKALLNPLILTKVFRSLDVPTLKSVRLLCTVWADVGATFLGNQGRLPFSTSSNCPTIYEELTSFNPELAKNIKLIFVRCLCTEICTCSANLPPVFVTILPDISAKMEALEFFEVKAFEPLQGIWSAYHFPNLTRISILVDGDELDEREPPTLEMTKFRPLPNLKVFSLKMLLNCNESLTTPMMSTISQKLVNSAPNLEEIDLEAPFHLDLTACGKLKKLRHYFYGLIHSELQVAEMVRMLTSCRNSLESLTLEYLGWPDAIELNFPNLTHLRLEAGDVVNISDSMNITNLPKLTHFSISKFHTEPECEISAMLEHYQTRHVGITSLGLCCRHLPDINGEDGTAGGKLVNLFPAVRELKFTLKTAFFPGYDQYFVDLMETLRSLGEWELSRGRVEFEIGAYLVPGMVYEHSHEFGSLLVIAVLRGMRGWRGLTNTSLQFNCRRSSYAKFRLLDEMRAAFLSCRTIRSVAFTGFLFDDETKDYFQTFTREYNLPISVKY